MKQKLIATALCAGLVLAGSTHDVSAATKPSVTKKLTVTVGHSKTIKAKGKSIQSKKFKSNKKSVATVTKKGKVTGRKAGKAKITVTVKYKKSRKVLTKKYTCTVTVKKRNRVTNVLVDKVSFPHAPSNSSNHTSNNSSQNPQIQKIVERAINQMQPVKSGIIPVRMTDIDGKSYQIELSYSGENAKLHLSGKAGENNDMDFYLITENGDITLYAASNQACLSTVLENAKISVTTIMNVDIDYSTAKLSETKNTYIVAAKSKTSKEGYIFTIDKATNNFIKIEFDVVNSEKPYHATMDMQNVGKDVAVYVPDSVKTSARSTSVEEMLSVLVLALGVSL